MSNINNQTKNLYAIDTVQDLSPESAAVIQGGIKIYTGANFTGKVRTAKGVPDLSKVPGGFNDQTSSVVNDTKVRWAFYTDANYKGRKFFVQPGKSFARLGSFNDQISSYRSEPA